jgi:hypothetical protein
MKKNLQLDLNKATRRSAADGRASDLIFHRIVRRWETWIPPAKLGLLVEG